MSLPILHASVAMQPHISTMHQIALRLLPLACYHSECLLALFPPSFEGSPEVLTLPAPTCPARPGPLGDSVEALSGSLEVPHRTRGPVFAIFVLVCSPSSAVDLSPPDSH